MRAVVFASVLSLVACLPVPEDFTPTACEPPTWEQCVAPITPCDRYFRAKAKEDSRSACNLLFEQKAAAEAPAFEEREVVVPYVSRVNGLPRAPSSPTRTVRAVPVKRESFSLTGLNGLALGQTYRDAALLPKSGSAATSRWLLLNQTRQQWEANGNRVTSCSEYVHEKFYDYTTFEDRLIRGGFDDHRRVYDIAYAEATPTPRWAIGTRHLTDAALKGRDGRVFGTLPFATSRLPKNQYFTVPAPRAGTRVQFVSGPDDRVLYLPATNTVLIRLAHLDELGRTALDFAGVALNDATLATTIDSGRAFYDESWAWHRQMAQRNAGLLDEVLYDFDRKQDDFALLLEERDRLAQALVALLDPGAAARVPVAGGQLDERWWLDPVWNPDPTAVSAAARQGVDIRDVSLGGLANLTTLTNHPAGSGIVTYAGGNGQATTAASVKPNVKQQVVAACTGNPVICASYRLAAIDAVIEEELVKARTAGCLDVDDTTGAAPCDWSPRRFARSVLGHFRAEREAVFQKCRDYVEDFAELQNKTLSFTNPDTGDSFFAQDDYSENGVALEKYYADLDAYLDVVGGYLGPLLDRKSGKVRLKKVVADETELGSDLFGARFAYGLSFEALDVGNDDTCVLQQRVDATMDVEAKLLGGDITIFEADVGVSDTTASLSAKVVGQELLSGASNIALGNMTVLRDTKQQSETFFEQSYTIVIGFVPVTLGGALVGAVGLDYGVEAGKQTSTSGGCRLVRSGVVGTVTPVAWVQAQAWAAVDAVVAEAGVKGSLTIVMARLPLKVDVGVGPSRLNPAALDITLNTEGALLLTFFSGSVSVYLELGVCPLCTSWEEPLIAWDGLQHRIPLFKTKASVRLADLRLLVKRLGAVP